MRSAPPQLGAFMPQGVAGVVTSSVPDVLCHAAVRARNSGTLLAACCAAQELAGLVALNGQEVTMQVHQVKRCITLHAQSPENSCDEIVCMPFSKLLH